MTASCDAAEGLLEALACRAGCEYLSDLNYLQSCRSGRLRRAVEDTEPAQATLRQWNEALRYLTGEVSPAPSPEAAKARILAAL